MKRDDVKLCSSYLRTKFKIVNQNNRTAIKVKSCTVHWQKYHTILHRRTLLKPKTQNWKNLLQQNIFSKVKISI